MHSRATIFRRLSVTLSLFAAFLVASTNATAQEVINENGGFEQSTAGQTSEISNWELLFNDGATAEVVTDPEDEANLVLRIEITDISVAANPWDIQIRHYANPELPLEEGHQHQMSFRIRAENPTNAVVQLDGQDGAQLWGQSISGDDWQTLETLPFTAGEADTRVIAIHLGDSGNQNGQVFYIDDLEVVDLDAETAPPPPSGGGNLVTNGSFEATEPGVVEDLAGGVEGWLFETSTDPVFVIVDDVARLGSQALRVEVNELGANAWDIQAVADSIEVTPGATYEYSVWARTSSGEGTAAFTVGNYAFSEYFALRDNITLTDEWQEFTGEFTITDDQTVIRAPIHFNFAANAGQSIYIDGLRIAKPGSGLEPVIVEAESGVIGSEFETLTDEESGAEYIAITTDFDETTGTPDFPGENRTVTYEVTFPEPGLYDLYARVRVGAGTFNDDSFFYGSGFGEKDPANADDWTMVNQLAAAGYSEPGDYIVAAGTAGSGMWKWVNLSENQLTGELPDTFMVEEGSLTHVFQIGAREDGLDIDKFAFGPAEVFYTVENLDNGEPGVTEVPGEGVPEPTGPPLAEGLDKWLGNIYSSPQTQHFEHYWNQVTPENAGKWASVEGTRDQMNWNQLDAAYALAKDNGWPFRFHVLVWGAQQPGWIEDLPEAEQLEEITEWFEAVADRYPEIDYLEVVNEPLHQPPDADHEGNYIDALGGTGATGWDWVITAFEMAREIFPEETQLMINDYGIVSSMTNASRYRDLIELLQDRDLIDAVGMQGHAFSTRASNFRGEDVLDLLAETGLPLMITEMDVDGNPNSSDISEEDSDANQLLTMQRVFPVFWEHEAVVGVTFWGWRPGLWRQDQEAYLVRNNGEERPALEWLRDYIESYATSDEDDDLPYRFALEQNYPNPFNPSTTIAYEVEAASHVHLGVYNLLGQRVATLVDQVRSPGRYMVELDAGSLASGVYLYRIEAGDRVQTRHMMLLK